MDPEVTHPTEADVLFGRCKVCFNHVGNIRFRLVIQTRAREYQGVTSRRDKSRIVYSVVQHVQNYGGRFLKRDNNHDWHVVSLAEAIQKVGHSLRDKKSGFPDENPKFGPAPKKPQIEKSCDLLMKLGEVCTNEIESSENEENDSEQEEEEDPKSPKKPSKGPLRKRHKLERIAEYNAKNKQLSLGSEEEDCAKAILQMSRGDSSTPDEDESPFQKPKKNVRKFKLGGPIFGKPATQITDLSRLRAGASLTASNPFNVPISSSSLASLHAKVPVVSAMSTIQQPGDNTSEKESLLKQNSATDTLKNSNVSRVNNVATDLLIRRHAILAAANYQKERTLLATFEKEAEVHRLLAKAQASTSYSIVPGYGHLRNPAWRQFTM